MSRRGKGLPKEKAAALGLEVRNGGLVDGVDGRGSGGRGSNPASESQKVDSVDGVDGVSRKKLPKVLPFPIDALPGSARRLVRETSIAMQCPPEYVALPLLTHMGSAIGNSRVIKIDESWVEPSIIFAVSVGVPGSMKSPPMGVVNKAANMLNRAFAREYREAYEKYGDDYREWEMERKSLAKEGTAPPRPPQEPVMRTCVVKDTTIEAYEEALESNPRGVPAIADELSGWYRRLNMYRQGKGADKTWWLERHNTNEPINTKRKGRKDPLLVQRPHVCLYGTIQPGVLPEINEDDDGLLERFLLVYPDSAVPLYSPEEITAAAQEAWERLYNALRSLHMPVDDYGDPLPQEVVASRRAAP